MTLSTSEKGAKAPALNAFLSAAISYFNYGMNVLPIGKDKRPVIKEWGQFQHERQTKAQIMAMDWRGAAGVAAITGDVSDYLVCIDFDHIEAGDPALAAFNEGLGLPLEYEWRVKTGGGWHIWLRCPTLDLDGKGRIFAPTESGGQVEVRYTGHYAILPPSIHPSGKRYEFYKHPEEAPMIVRFDVLIAAWRRATIKPVKQAGRVENYVQSAIRAELAILGAAKEGGRNDQLFKSALKMGGFIGQGLTRPQLESDLLYVAQQIGLEEGEARATIKSALDRAKERDIPEHLARPSPLPAAGISPAELQEIKDYSLTDVGNGRRLVGMYGAELRFCHEWESWLVWDQSRWNVDKTGEIERLAKDVARSIQALADSIPDAAEKLKTAITKHAQRSESAGKIHAMIDMARTETEVKALANDFDADIWLLNCENGVIDLTNGRLSPHDPKYMLTKRANAPYQPDAQCPVWMGFLDRIMGGNDEMITFLQRAIGYSLTGATSEQVIFFLYGTGANGKSTLLEALRFLLADYSQNTPITALMRKSDGASPTPDLARLKGARFVTAVEAEENQHLSESTVKAITGGDTITARNLFSSPFEFKPELKLWIGTNYKPRITGTDNGIWRRIRLINFGITIPAEERDPHLTAKLQQEAAGILAWAVRGCLDWQRDGLSTPAEVMESTNQYRSEQDVMAAFIQDCCWEGLNARASASALYESYKHWCDESNERVLSQRKFGMKLKERGYHNEKDGYGRTRWLGLGILTEDTEHTEEL